MTSSSSKEMSLTPKKISKVKAFDAATSFSIEGIDSGTFAIATSKKDLKQLKTSDADVVYDEKKGKLYLNENGEEKGWGTKKIGGLVAKFNSKPELTADHFDGLKLFDDDELTGHKDVNGGGTLMETMFTSRKAARKAAKSFGCKGAHQMGDYWMPCKEHGAMIIEEDVHSGQDHSGYDYSGYDYSGY